MIYFLLRGALPRYYDAEITWANKSTSRLEPETTVDFREEAKKKIMSVHQELVPWAESRYEPYPSLDSNHFKTSK